jgi:hypothetical protein
MHCHCARALATKKTGPAGPRLLIPAEDHGPGRIAPSSTVNMVAVKSPSNVAGSS